ncbi:hypothetical protein [Pseudanabaena sp. ABRG5-3]|uniref:hypothetical protein n=1 Tax=Pseudanabaena sp. ABRG5-3 TaxID=685565 RepID=UPI000F8422EB|nr:hypothetical protein [Pseudanabaena sp. ABRG5-3]
MYGILVELQRLLADAQQESYTEAIRLVCLFPAEIGQSKIVCFDDVESEEVIGDHFANISRTSVNGCSSFTKLLMIGYRCDRETMAQAMQECLASLVFNSNWVVRYDI